MFGDVLRRFGSFFRFLVSGGLAAVTLFGSLYLLTDVLGWWYVLASAASGTAAFVVSFTLHKFWTFGNTNMAQTKVQFLKHLGVGLVNVGVNTLFLFILVDYLHMYYLLAQALVSGTVAVISFFIYKYFIFHEAA
jgi:putative flippase GtrA